jgi:hypothetical protein
MGEKFPRAYYAQVPDNDKEHRHDDNPTNSTKAEPLDLIEVALSELTGEGYLAHGSSVRRTPGSAASGALMKRAKRA